MATVIAVAASGSAGADGALAGAVAATTVASAAAGSLEALEHACFGEGLPAPAERELQLASRCYAAEDVAERHLLRACELAPEHPATLIGLYRFYFYRNRLGEALALGMRCLDLAARANGLVPDWTKVRGKDIDFSSLSVLPRFYLFTLKACAYLRLRLGDLICGGAMLDKLTELDPTDKVNASVLRGVLDRLGQDDEE